MRYVSVMKFPEVAKIVPTSDCPLLETLNPLLEKDGTKRGVRRETPVPLCRIVDVLGCTQYFEIAAGEALTAGSLPTSFTAVSQIERYMIFFAERPDFALCPEQEGSNNSRYAFGVAIEQLLHAGDERFRAIGVRGSAVNSGRD